MEESQDQDVSPTSLTTGPLSSLVSGKNCTVCFGNYNANEKRPRFLPCGHTFCSECIEKNYDGRRVLCPECRLSAYASTPSEFPINFGLESLLHEFGSGTTYGDEEVSSPTAEAHPTISKRLRSLRNELVCGVDELTATSKSLSLQLHYYDSQLDKWKGEHEGFITQLEDMVKKLTKESRKVKDAIEEEVRERRKTEMASNTLKCATVGNEILKAVENVNLCSEDLENWTEMTKEEFPNCDLIIQTKELRGRYKPGPLKSINSQDNGSSSGSPVHPCQASALSTQDQQNPEETQDRNESTNQSSSLTMQDKIHVAFKGVTSWLKDGSSQTQQEDSSKDARALTAKDLLDRTPFNQRLLVKTKVLAVQEDAAGNPKRYSTLRMDNKQRLIVSALKDFQNVSLEDGYVLLKHDDVMSLLDGTSRRVFLELGAEGVSLGRLVIRLIDEGNYTKNFLHLCIGDKGPTYIHSKILKASYIGTYDEFVTCGDYERNDGNGGRAVVAGVDWEEEWEREIYNRPSCTIGLVEAGGTTEEEASLFSINTKDSIVLGSPPTFGKVEEGLEVLSAAIARYSDITQVKIVNCGLVLFS